MKLQISTCIIHNNDNQNLWNCLSKVKTASDELIVVHSGTTPKTDGVDLNIDIPLLFVVDKGNFQKAAGTAVQMARGKWILVMKSDEILTAQSGKTLRGLIKESKESAFAVICQRQADSTGFENGLSRYEWVGNWSKYQTTEVRRYNVVSDLEVRLFKRKWFQQFLLNDNGSLIPIFRKELTTIPMSSIRIEQSFTHSDSSMETTQEQKLHQDYRQFENDQEEDLSRYEGFEILGPNNFGYSLINEANYTSIIAGLEMGLGHVEILKFMLLFLIKEGNYNEAIEFAEKITSKMGDKLEIWRLKGDAFFHKLDLANAEASYLKALSLKEDYPEILLNLAKVYLILEKFPKAREILLRLKEMKMQAPEIDFFINSIEEKRGDTPKLSLLMLCRDEENCIAKALGSAKDIVDEMVIIDTGSKDRTRSIARGMGAKVIEYPWNDHFSEARNVGLEHTNGDYIIWLDASEFIERKVQIALLVFKSILSSEKKKGVVFRVETYTSEADAYSHLPPDKIIKRTAVFPRIPGISFSGRVFESVDSSLGALGINRIFAEDVRFINIRTDTDARNQHQLIALNKCTAESLPIEAIFRGILCWLDSGNSVKAEEWFERAVFNTQNKYPYTDIIGLLAKSLVQKGYLKTSSSVFPTLVKKFQDVYPIVSLCADMLYQDGAFENAAALYEKILYGKNGTPPFTLNEKTRHHNLVYLVASNLENDNFQVCDRVFDELAREDDMYDTLKALQIYSAIRKKEIEPAIILMDAWIQTRNLTIKATIDSFLELVRVTVQIAEIMADYGQTDASGILSRSGQYLVESLHMKE